MGRRLCYLGRLRALHCFSLSRTCHRAGWNWRFDKDGMGSVPSRADVRLYFATTTGMDGKKGWIGRENGEGNVQVRESELDSAGKELWSCCCTTKLTVCAGDEMLLQRRCTTKLMLR